MKNAAFILSLLALLTTFLWPVLFLSGCQELAAVKRCLAVSAAVWFVCTPLWMRKAE